MRTLTIKLVIQFGCSPSTHRRHSLVIVSIVTQLLRDVTVKTSQQKCGAVFFLDTIKFTILLLVLVVVSLSLLSTEDTATKSFR